MSAKSRVYVGLSVITHWGRVTWSCASKLNIIGWDNGLAPSHYLNQCWKNVNFTTISEILIEIHKFAFKKMHLEIPSPKSRPFCLGRNVWTVHCARKQNNSASLSYKSIYTVYLYISSIHGCDTRLSLSPQTCHKTNNVTDSKAPKHLNEDMFCRCEMCNW